MAGVDVDAAMIDTYMTQIMEELLLLIPLNEPRPFPWAHRNPFYSFELTFTTNQSLNEYTITLEGKVGVDQNYESGTISGPGGTARYSGYTTSYQNYTFNKPRAENTIVMLRERPTDSVSYNAQIIYNSLTSKYGL